MTIHEALDTNCLELPHGRRNGNWEEDEEEEEEDDDDPIRGARARRAATRRPV